MSEILTAMAGAADLPGVAPECSAATHDRWFVGFTKSREEARAQENLLRQGFECHLPLMRVKKRTKGMQSWRRVPLFPRYLFLRPGPDAAPMDRVRSTLGMTGLVRFAGMPATVAQAVVVELKDLGEDFQQAPFKPGESVRLVDGPLAALAGIFERADGEARAIVLLEFLSREHRIAVPMDCVQASG